MKGIMCMHHGKPTTFIFCGFALISSYILYLWFWGPRSKGIFRLQVGTRSFGDVKSPQNIWGTKLICQFEGEQLARKIGKLNIDGSCKLS